MLVIRDAQRVVFRDNAVRRFQQELSNHLRSYFPGPCAALGDGGKLDAFVVRSMDLAQQHGISGVGAITVYAELLIQFGENFERSPLREWTRNILAHPMLPGTAKVNTIRDRHQEQTQGRVLIAF